MTETLLTLAGKRVIGVANKYVQRTPDRVISLVWGVAHFMNTLHVIEIKCHLCLQQNRLYFKFNDEKM
jgi:hypothetical protein